MAEGGQVTENFEGHVEESKSSTNARDVFVVHGRNLAARDAVFAFLEAIDLRPLEWQEIMDRTGSGSPYIGRSIDKAFQTAQAVVVLLTPDDEARLREPFLDEHDPNYERVLTGQARPNVLFESGMALAHHEERTILVQLGEVRPFSDIAGRLVLRFTDTAQSRNELASRLRTAGCAVHTTGNRWLEAGDFAAALAETSSQSQDTSREVIVAKEDQYSPQALAEDQAGGKSSEWTAGDSLTADAQELLLAAGNELRGGYITRSRYGGLLQIATAEREFVSAQVTVHEARVWSRALDELYDNGLVDNNSAAATTYYITPAEATKASQMNLRPP